MFNAPLIVFDFFSNALLMLGWLIQNALWDVFTQTGLAAVPFIALIVSEWYRARQEGDDEGNKGVLSVNRIETRLYAMAIVFLFTCQPILPIQLSTVDVDIKRSEECGVRQFSSGQWGESTLNSLDGQVPSIPVWWAFVHAVSHGVTGAAIAAIPCTTDYQSIRTELDLNSIEDPVLQREVGEFQLSCFGPARNRLFQQSGSVDSSRGQDVDWIGSSYFLETPGYYDNFYAGRPVQGFPYNETRDVSRPNTGPGQDGYPTCSEWWSAGDVGLRARLHDQVDTKLWDSVRSVFTRSDAEDYVIRRMVSPRSGAANGNLNQAAVGYRDIDGGGHSTGLDMLVDIAVSGGAILGGGIGALPFQSGMDMAKQALPMIQAILVMAIVICLPFVMLISGYSFKVAGVATFGLFATWFLTFWWEIARWMSSNLVELIYKSDAAKMSWLSAATNMYDRMVLMFVEGTMFFVLPALWVGVLGWAGMSIGSAVGRSVNNATGEAQGAGKSGGSKVQSKASGGKL